MAYTAVKTAGKNTRPAKGGVKTTPSDATQE